MRSSTASVNRASENASRVGDTHTNRHAPDLLHCHLRIRQAVRVSERERREVFAQRFQALSAPTRAFAAGLIALPEVAARTLTEQSGRAFRVAQRDGVPLALTADLRSDRVNATLEQCLVVRTDVG
jgi:hypothetical protein